MPAMEDEEIDLYDVDDRLSRVVELQATLALLPWFSRLGEEPSAQDRVASDRYLNALGFGSALLVPVVNWEDALFALENPGHDDPWWEAEELARSELMQEALHITDEDVISQLIDEQTRHVVAHAFPRVEEALRDTDQFDEAILGLATGAVAHICFQKTMALLGGDDDHAFHFKFDLFAAGRWPLSLTGNSFNLF